MKFQLLATMLIGALFSFQTIAAPNCPLENVKYKSLRESVTVLLKNVELEPGCEAQSDILKNATQDINDIVTDSTSDNTDSSTVDQTALITQSADAAVTKTTTAINSISSINNVLRGKCGRKLMGTMDYLEALTDTVVGLGPLLLLQEGNTSLVLYTTVVGQVVKSLIDFFRGKKVDMEKQEERDKFIKNSCSFYALNNKIRALLYTLNTQMEVLEANITTQQKIIADLKKEEPPKPEHSILKLEERHKAHIKEVKRIEALMGKFSVSKFTCLAIQRSINKGLGVQISDTLAALLDASEESQDLRLFLQYFSSVMDQTETMHEEKCDEIAKDWIATVNDLLKVTTDRLNEKKKVLSKFEPSIEYNNWTKQMSEATAKLKKFEEQKKSLTAMTSNGHNIDLSEILDTRDSIKKALFANQSWRAKSVAHSWLEYKIEQSYENLRLFIKKDKRFNKELKDLRIKELSDRDREDLCLEAETLWDSWTTASSHYGAAKTYCDAFRKIITKSEFKRTFNYCYEKEAEQECDDNDHFNTGHNNCTSSSSIDSVEAQRLELAKHNEKVEQIKATMEQLHCAKPAFFSL